MSDYTRHTAPTQYVEVAEVRLAYRRFGKKAGLPLVFIPHILGTMDSGDPCMTDGFARDREVILFDNAGIASSSGEVPTTLAEMARTAGAFVDALDLPKVDVLGSSIGSMLAQNVALEVSAAGAARDGAQNESVAAKIRRPLLAGPSVITKDATVAKMGADGKMTVLRQGTNNWICTPGDENKIGDPPMCADPVAMLKGSQ